MLLVYGVARWSTNGPAKGWRSATRPARTACCRKYPAIITPKSAIAVRGRHVSRRCFVKGRQHLILPAFGALTGGMAAQDPAIEACVGGPAEAIIGLKDKPVRFPLPFGDMATDIVDERTACIASGHHRPLTANSPPMDRFKPYRDQLATLEKAGRKRQLLMPGGKDFSSNDYLGLAHSAYLRDVAQTAIANGIAHGSGGSRLLGGNHPEHEALEAFAARHYGAEASLFFGSGFAANAACSQPCRRPATCCSMTRSSTPASMTA